MEKMIDLRDLLQHEIMDLYSAEEQIIEALPDMIAKAKNSSLKKALKDHLKVTEEQKSRLDEVRQLLDGEGAKKDESDEKKKGFFSNLFGGSESKQFCKGTEGLVKEGKKMMSGDMSPEVLDAVIIASAQKIEHYEISGYGTARAYARELKLNNVAALLEQTLNEEYEADDLLTKLAIGNINEKAESVQMGNNGRKATVGSNKLNGKEKSSSTRQNSTPVVSKKSSGNKASAKVGKKSAVKSSAGKKGK